MLGRLNFSLECIGTLLQRVICHPLAAQLGRGAVHARAIVVARAAGRHVRIAFDQRRRARRQIGHAEAERRRTDYRIQGLPKGTAEVAYQITLRNAKSQDVTVDIVERMIGEWQILSQSLPHKKDTDRQAVWQVPVPAGGEVSLRYKALMRFR